jgi:2-C-methyl-D-erythritol 4-phosphate cytidylyltransferase
MKVAAIVPAAGVGVRMKSGVKKQYLELEGRPILAHTLLRLCQSEIIDSIVVVSHADEIQRTREEIVDKYDINKNVRVVEGGETRQESVTNGFNHVPRDFDIVLTHDGVRPFITPKIICDVVDAAIEHGAAIAAIRSTDTLKSVKDGFIQKAIGRHNTYRVQTPQAFRFDILNEALDLADRENFQGTDESSLVERMGLPIKVVDGSALNLKITTPEQMQLGEMVFKIQAEEQEI